MKPGTPTPSTFFELANRVVATLDQYRQHSQTGEEKVLRHTAVGPLTQTLDLEKWIRTGGLDHTNLEDFLAPYLAASQHVHSPAFIGHQVAIPHRGAIMGDLIHGVTNNAMAVYEMGPSATVVERVIINWMLEKAGWFLADQLADFSAHPGNGAGVLTHGGSLANLTAVLAARAAAFPHAWQDGTPDNLVIIAPAATHYSIARAAAIAGMGQNAVYPAPVNALDQLRAGQLESVYRRACDDGKTVFMVSLNACATATGLYDPIDEVADFCAAHNLWLHVDGAHGASALLSDKYRHHLNGVSRANSLTWDAHKMLRTSALCAAILFKDPAALGQAFSQEGSYIFYEENHPGFDVGRTTIECTKAALGAKLFMVLAIEGEKALGQFVEKQYDDTRTFYELISAQSDFECPYQPQSNILCFRYLPLGDNQAQMNLRQEIVRRGNFYITTAIINQTRYLRLAVMNPLTSTATIIALLDEIRTCAKGKISDCTAPKSG